MMIGDLIAKLEAASEGSRELDAEIARAVGWRNVGKRGGYVEIVGTPAQYRGVRRVLHYTTSLDDAMTLKPDGWGFKCECGLGYGNAFTVGHVGKNCLYDRPEGYGKGATPALALTIAALKARQV